MSVYDELSMFWGVLIFLICVTVYGTGWVCYKLGFKDGEADMARRISRHAERKIRRGEFKRLR